jgi:hypothetical protein
MLSHELSVKSLELGATESIATTQPLHQHGEYTSYIEFLEYKVIELVKDESDPVYGGVI